MYIYIYTYIIYIYIYIHKDLYTYIHTGKHTCMCVYMAQKAYFSRNYIHAYTFLTSFFDTRCKAQSGACGKHN